MRADYGDICRYLLFVEIQKRRNLIHADTLGMLRTSIIHKEGIPDSSVYTRLLDRLFPYWGLIKQDRKEMARKMMEEELGGPLIVTAVGKEIKK